MCNDCNNSNKSGFATVLAVISGIVVVAAAVSAAVYFVLKYIEKKEQCDYIECDCYGDYDGYEYCEDGSESADSDCEAADNADASNEDSAE